MSGQIIKDYIRSKKWQGTLRLSEVQNLADFIADDIEELKKSRNFPGMDGGEYDSAINDIQTLLREPPTN